MIDVTPIFVAEFKCLCLSSFKPVLDFWRICRIAQLSNFDSRIIFTTRPDHSGQIYGTAAEFCQAESRRFDQQQDG